MKINVPAGAPPHVHRRNAAEHSIRTFKAHFLSILARVDTSFPNYLWDKLLPLSDFTLNMIQQSTLAPAMSFCEHINEMLNQGTTPLGIAKCHVLIHIKPNTHLTWDFCGRNGYIIGPALCHYRCHTVVDATTKDEIINDTVEDPRYYVSQLTLTHEDRISHALKFLSCAIQDAPATAHHNQLEAIVKLQELFGAWNPDKAAEITPPQS